MHSKAPLEKMRVGRIPGYEKQDTFNFFAMKHIALFFIAGTMLLLFVVAGCKKDLDFTTNGPTSESTAGGGWDANERDGEGPTVLGSQHQIPYKVDVIQQAYNYLYQTNITNMAPNYLYVRFLPQSPEDVKKLLQSGIELWDIPLDYDVISWGETYHDPTVTDANYTWQYAVVEVNATLPSVQYELLERLALVPEDCAIAQKAFEITGNAYEIPEVFEANPALVDGKFEYRIENENPTDGDGGGGGGTGGGGTTTGGGGGSDCGCPLPNHIRKPSGCVQVFDNMLNGWQGVIRVEVITSKTQIFGFIFHRKTETNGNGCWQINHKYRGKIHVWVRWESSTCNIKTMEGMADLWGYTFPRREHIGSFNGPNFNNIPIKFNFTAALGTDAFLNWSASTVNNAIYEFGGFVGSQGISTSVPGNLKVLITPWGSGGNTGAAPMFDKMGFIQQFILFGSANAILAGVLNVLAPGVNIIALPLAVWLEVAAPDIALNLNNAGQVNSDDVRELMYHELAHSLHFNQVGSNYWLDNIFYTMQHLGYGDGTAPGAGRCSVIESWGFQIGLNSTHLRYGTSNSNPGNPVTNTWRARLERALAWGPGSTHIPFAWEWDLQDDNTVNPLNETENASVTDRVLGVSNAQIFSTMNANMQSMPQMKAAVIPFLPPTVPMSTYNILCTPYGF